MALNSYSEIWSAGNERLITNSSFHVSISSYFFNLAMKEIEFLICTKFKGDE